MGNITRKRKDYTGQKFNHYTVVSDAPDYIDKQGHHIRQVNCLCDCGNKELQIVKLTYLIQSETQGCPLCSKQRRSLTQKQNKVNRKYNHYIFLKDCVYIYPQDRNDIYTILDYKWYEYFQDKYIFPRADRHKGYYWKIKQDKKSINIHNIIAGKNCDHINRNKSDNRECNLRIASTKENSRNREKSSNNSSGFKGVFFDKKQNKYVTQLRCDNKLMYFGSFNNAEEAARQYDKAALKYFKEFAYTNFPKEEYTNIDYNNITPSTMKNRQRTYGRKNV